MNIIAQKFGLNFYSNGSNLHLLTEKRFSKRFFKIIVRYRYAILLNVFYRRKSLAGEDYRRITGKELY